MFSGEGLINDLATAEYQGGRFAETAGAKSLEELRKIPADTLLKIPGRWGITIDSAVVISPFEAFQRGIHNDVPLITGWNADDGFMMGKPLSSAEYIKFVRGRYGEKADEYLTLFPGSDDTEAALSQKIQAQMFFSLSNYRWADHQVRYGKNKAWLYYFSRVPPGEPDYGAFHSAEFGYALSNLKLWNRPFTETDFKLSEAMSGYWINFAKNGDPNGAGLPGWDSFSEASKRAMEFSDKPQLTDVPSLRQLEYMDKLTQGEGMMKK
jgi:para-nitrobenzyl esterase